MATFEELSKTDPNQAFKQGASLSGSALNSYVSPSGSIQNPPQNPQPIAPTITGQSSQTSPFALAQVMTALQSKVQSNNALMSQRNLLLKQLYDQPLTDQEKQQLDPTMLQAINSGDRNQIDMKLRLISDEVSGRAQSLDKSIQYLTQTYQDTLTQAETKKKDAFAVLKEYATQTGDSGILKQFIEQNYGSYLNSLGISSDDLLNGAGLGGTASISVNNVSGIKDASGNFVAYSSPEESLQATIKDLKAKQTGQTKTGLNANSTLEQLINTWITGSPTGTPTGYSAKDVAKDLGVTPETKIGGLDTRKLAESIAKHETGYGTKVSGTSDYVYGDFLKTLAPEEVNAFNKLNDMDKSSISSLIKGDIDIPTLMQSRGLSGSMARQKLLEKVKSVDPTYSDNRYKVKQQWDNPNGKAFLTRSAMNTAMSHMATTYQSALALGNTKIPKYNEIANWASKNTGNPELTSFVYDLTALSGEIASAYKNGTAPSELDTQRFFDAMSGSMSPEQFKGVFTQSSKLLAGKLKSLAQEFKQSAGRYPTDPIIQPSVLEELKSIGIDTTSIDKLLQEQGYTVGSSTGTGDNDPMGLR